MEASLEIASRILFEDNHLIIVNKLPGEIVQGDKTGDEPLSERVKRYLEEKYNKPGKAFLGTIHRIDRPVSGLVMFAKTSKALERMNALLRDKKVEKSYWAVVTAAPPDKTGKVSAFLKKNEAKNKSFVSDKTVKGALFSELDYEWTTSSDRYHLLKISPATGRHHQIRVLLAHIGCIIKGDLKYGARRSNTDASIHLHAREVRFVHPVTHEDIQVVAPAPKEVLWEYFEEALK